MSRDTAIYLFAIVVLLKKSESNDVYTNTPFQLAASFWKFLKIFRY